jgi:hypothetical protein
VLVEAEMGVDDVTGGRVDPLVDLVGLRKALGSVGLDKPEKW